MKNRLGKFCEIVLVWILANAVSTLGHEYDSCVQSNGQPGICVTLYACDHALLALRQKIQPDSCGFKRDIPLVCCNPYGIKSKKKCAEYHSFNYDSDGPLFVLAAVGGENALSQEFPHMAALGFGEKNDIQWNCGGTLISDQYVLTAAHCLYTPEYGFVKHIRLGDLNLVETNDDAEPQDFEAAELIRHPDYKPPSKYHDIALIKLNRPATLGLYATPACLDTRNNLTDVYPVATGWGRLSFGGETSPHLQKVRLSMYSLEDCKKTYNSVSKRVLPNGFWDETQICAGSKTEVKDTCQGDSGGPLQVSHEKYVFKPFSIIGVTSFGKGCGLLDTPAVYTRVSYYIPWIESIVWPNL